MTSIKSEVLLLSKLLIKGRFTVPWHQRYYDWNAEQIDDLLVDLKEAMDEGRTSYFLGTIMLVERRGTWEINDGQQRLITVSLLFAALRRVFSKRPEQDFLKRETIIFTILCACVPGTGNNLRDQPRAVPRIVPSRHDRLKFTQIIQGYEIGTNGKLTSAWNAINLFCREMGPEEIDNFFNFIIGKVEVVALYVPETEDVNAIFEALNSRGKQLDDVDLIRNYLFSFFSSSDDVERRIKVHKQLESIRTICRTVPRSEQYFRCFFQCNYGYIQKKRFYRETRKKIRDSTINRDSGNYVFEMIRELANPSKVELFRTLTATNPSTELVSRFCISTNTIRKKRNLPVFLHELAAYKVTLPLVFALLGKFLEADDTDRKSISRAVHYCLSDLCSFVMRVSFCSTKFEPSKYEAAFANCARRITKITVPSEITIRDELQECDVTKIMNNAHFIALLSEVNITNMMRAKRLLFGINREQENEMESVTFAGCTVEHILPRSSHNWGRWSKFHSAKKDTVDLVSRVGNLTLLGTSDGRSRLNDDFATKKNFFAKSSIKITRQITSYDDWGPEIVRTRSEEIASEAARVWAFPLRRNC